jgi:hypothetical protein
VSKTVKTEGDWFPSALLSILEFRCSDGGAATARILDYKIVYFQMLKNHIDQGEKVTNL